MENQFTEAGKPSMERPWMKNYPPQLHDLQIPHCTLTEYLAKNDLQSEAPVVHYYGRDLRWKDLFAQVDAAAKALSALGCGEGDRLPVFLQAVPEYIVLVLAAEKIGAALVCRDGTPQECAAAIRGSASTILFAHSYLSKEDEELFLNETQLERIVLISPYNSADRAQMPDHIIRNLQSLEPGKCADNQANLTWQQFLDLADGCTAAAAAPRDPDRPLFCAYTSGSTGPAKQVIHSAATMIGIIHQMAVFTAALNIRLTWLHTIIPPSLVAATVTMIFSPICSGDLLILDPFTAVNDLDLELMRYRPNCWALIPEFLEVLMRSPRIPEDYAIDYLFAAGAGAEPLNNRQIERVQKFYRDHKCPSSFSVGYGMSEGGSGFTMPSPTDPLEDFCCGMPMVATTLSIFQKGTQTELSYGEIGEICKSGPGIMIGYGDQESTDEVLQYHQDGKLWLHTGDYGYMTENGSIHVLGRGCPERFGGGQLFVMQMENKIIYIPGIEDGFFALLEDHRHKGFYIPYLYLVLEDGAAIEDIRKEICNALEPHEYPAEITIIKERPYFHFKTDRKGLMAQKRREISFINSMMPKMTGEGAV